ncbi:LysR family transcriptional regulator [Rhodobacteraceae bacterium M382]|nr:LysR family transcriptional regulator [Rhodobacteraceae bacterium M382]
MKTLPPLSQFQAFEAAARHLSFSRSAIELNVQQPAISRQIGALEAALGVKLFLRSKPNLTLTPEGETLFAAVSSGLEAIRNGARSVQQAQRDDVIVVNAAIGFTSLYLLPRMAEFQARFPDVRLEVVTRDQNPDYDPALCDITVVFGARGPAGMSAKMIFNEELIPVCAPGYLRNDTPLPLADLANQHLLHMSSPDHGGDWGLYFAETNLMPPEPRSFERILSYMVYLRAIQMGNGIGLGWGRLIDELLASGSLVPACTRTWHTDRGYFCCITPRAADTPAALAFQEWITRG